jgi:ribosome recycling factor
MIKNNDKFIVFIREYDAENKNITSSIVYNTEEEARDVIKDYELSHQDKKYAIKLIRGEILDSFYKEI